jgi:hypothetical protein
MARTISRTWVHEWPTPSPAHKATLLINDEIVASAEGDDWLTAAHNLRQALRERRVPVEGQVIACDVFERMFQPRRSTRSYLSWIEHRPSKARGFDSASCFRAEIDVFGRTRLPGVH